MRTRIDFSEILVHATEYVQNINAFLQDQVQSFEPEIQELIEYCLVKGGKRIRPLLVYFSGVSEDEAAMEDLVKLGAIIELVHMATLVHDDILDDASVRHKRESVYAKYGASVAVLLGDALFSHALKLAAEFPTVDICREVAASTRTVCAGEIHQTFERGEVELSLEKYYRAIEMKTAELFRVSCFLGAKLGGYPADYTKAVGQFGYHLGTAYQIFDDYADITGDEDRFGKTLNTDLLRGKYTLPMLLLFEAIEVDTRQKILDQLNIDKYVPVKEITELMSFYEIKGKVIEHFERQTSAAEQLLVPHEDKMPTARLRDILHFVSEQIRVLT